MREEWKLLLELLYEIVEYLDLATTECPADVDYINHMRNLLGELSRRIKENDQTNT